MYLTSSCTTEKHPTVNSSEIHDLIYAVMEAYRNGSLRLNTSAIERPLQWNIPNSVLFAASVVTTIGENLSLNTVCYNDIVMLWSCTLHIMSFQMDFIIINDTYLCVNTIV